MDSNDKILLSGSNVSLGLARNAPNLRGIRDDFAALCLQNLLCVTRTTLCVGCVAFVTISLHYVCKIYSLSP